MRIESAEKINMIDILLATYNGRKHLREQIDSILTQSNQDWRLLIRDDISNDDTLDIIKEYVAKYSDRIILIEDDKKHLGAMLNFQCLLQNSTAEYIMFCDQDDVWLPTKIEATLNLMKGTEKAFSGKPILVHTDLRVVNHELATIAKSMWAYQGTHPANGGDFNKIMFQNVVTGCSAMINKKAKAISMPIPAEAVMHDWWIALNVAKHGKIAYIPQQLVLYRQHRNNAVGAKGDRTSLKERVFAHCRMIKKYDPTLSFWSIFVEKVANKIIQKYNKYRFFPSDN